MTDTVLARLAALKTLPITQLKQRWRDLFDNEPPPFNRRYLENRLAYRIQELAYGGLKPDTIKRLEALAEDLDSNRPAQQRRFATRPVIGTQLIREWQGTEHRVTCSTEASSIKVGRSIPFGDCARHHRHPLERLDLLRPEKSAVRRMNNRC